MGVTEAGRGQRLSGLLSKVLHPGWKLCQACTGHQTAAVSMAGVVLDTPGEGE